MDCVRNMFYWLVLAGVCSHPVFLLSEEEGRFYSLLCEILLSVLPPSLSPKLRHNSSSLSLSSVAGVHPIGWLVFFVFFFFFPLFLFKWGRGIKYVYGVHAIMLLWFLFNGLLIVK